MLVYLFQNIVALLSVSHMLPLLCYLCNRDEHKETKYEYVIISVKYGHEASQLYLAKTRRLNRHFPCYGLREIFNVLFVN